MALLAIYIRPDGFFSYLTWDEHVAMSQLRLSKSLTEFVMLNLFIETLCVRIVTGKPLWTLLHAGLVLSQLSWVVSCQAMTKQINRQVLT